MARPEVRLTAEEFERVFRDAVEAPALRRTEESPAPCAVYLGGQPGSGKSTFARMFSAIFGSSNFVHVDVDRLRPLHPAYLPMMADPHTERSAPSAVQRDCSLWADQLRDSAISARRNMLIENTMRAPGQVRESATALRNAGYAIEARLLAVHPLVSAVSLSQRYEHEKRALGFGREMPLDYHELAASGIVDTVLVIEAEKLVDRLHIVDRNGNTVYENDLVKGQWRQAPRGAQAMQEFREASLNALERQSIVRLWDDVLTMMEKRCAPRSELDAVDRLRVAAQRALARLEPLAMPCSGGREVSAQVEPASVNAVFNGRILEVNDKFVVQKIGRDPDRIARHDVHALTRIPKVGEVVDIQYSATKVGQVSEQALQRAHSR